jgi:transcriptional regulator with XRE-family HTH domain
MRPAATMTPTAHALPGNRWTALIDGHHLRNSRSQHGLTRDQLASKAGISVTTVARLERHPRTRCRSRTLARLAAALDQPPAALTPSQPPGHATR